MNKLIQTEESSIIYGTFRGKENQELFRCPRACDDTDIPRYVNMHRALVCPMGADNPFVDDGTADLRAVEGMDLVGYWRMYFRNGFWDGRWMLEGDLKPSKAETAGVNVILDWIYSNFEKGCDYYMKDYFSDRFKPWGLGNRYLVKPFQSIYYKMMVDTTYGNGDYPVRIYVYREKGRGE